MYIGLSDVSTSSQALCCVMVLSKAGVMCNYWVAQKKTQFSWLNREPALWLKMNLFNQLRNLKRLFLLTRPHLIDYWPPL